MSDRPSDGTSADAVTHRTEATPAERVADQVAPEPVAARRKQGFPSALTILIWVNVGVWLVALVIPSGEYRLDESGHPIPGSFQEIDSPLTFGESVRELLLSPINGLYGIQIRRRARWARSTPGSCSGRPRCSCSYSPSAAS